MKTQIMVALALAAGLSSVAAASPVTHTFSVASDDGFNYAATANFIFDADANTLDIQLINTGVGEAGSAWLTGLFFSLDGQGSSALTYVDLGGNESDHFNDLVDFNPETEGLDPAAGSYTADMFWGLNQDAGSLNLPGGGTFGLYASGFFGLPDGNGDVLKEGGPNPQPNGSDGGIVNDNSPFPGQNDNNSPYVRDGLWLQFSVDQDFELSAVSDVHFHWGTSDDQFGLSVVPVPPALFIGGLGLIGAALMRRRMSA